MKSKYDASSIEVLSGLDPVRKNPSMFTDTANPNHLAQEVIDNSADEALAGYANEIRVQLKTDGSIVISDDGRGMPVDLHPKLKKSGVEVILTTLHAGSKFSQKSYRYSGGLHGVGVSVVNALSRQLEVRVRRGGKEYTMHFHQGVPAGSLTVARNVARNDTGTATRFVPDEQFFTHSNFQRGSLKHNLQAKAVLCPGLKIIYRDEIADEECIWQYRDGLDEYFNEMLGEWQATVLPQHFGAALQRTGSEISWCVNWLVNDSRPLFTASYVNLIPTPQGGTHVNGLRAGLTTAIREFIKFHKLAPKAININGEDVMKNVCYMLSVKMECPQFSGQTKERLSAPGITNVVQNLVCDAFSLWLNQHKKQAALLAELVVANTQKRKRKIRNAARKSSFSSLNLPPRLSDCSSDNISETELFLVEGDSAGGSAKQARDRRFQAIMPLRGKIMNTWEVSTDVLFGSEEIRNISAALGIKIGQSDLDGLRYAKVCILADADSDGLHIAALLITLFQKHFPALVASGHLYIVLPPLFRIDSGTNVYYAADTAERDGYLQQLSHKQRKSTRITRFKGLGEMNPQQLRESVMAVENRRLFQLSCRHNAESTALLDMLMTRKRASERRSWLENHGNLASDLR